MNNTRNIGLYHPRLGVGAQEQSGDRKQNAHACLTAYSLSELCFIDGGNKTFFCENVTIGRL
jgi:hypothetical protein